MITTLPLTELGDEADLGPAMRALTPMRRAFVVAKVCHGLNDVAAARAAGYADANSHAWGIARREDVQAAILEIGKGLLRGEGSRSLRVMVEIRDDPTVKPDIRLKAAIEIANRAGFHVTTEHHLEVTHRLTEAEQDRRILALAAELGMPPAEAARMLIAPSDMARNAAGVYEIAPAGLSDNPANVAKRGARARRAGMSPEEVAADKAAVRAAGVERLRREYAAAQRDAEFEELGAETAPIAGPDGPV